MKRETQIKQTRSDFDEAGRQLLAELPRWKFWKRKDRARVIANLERARLVGDVSAGEATQRRRSKKLKGIAGS